MPDTRREFLKKAALLAARGSAAGSLALSIERALAVEPGPGTTFRDAEHVVILMQENRSFDHVYGRLRGVRGFNDPRAVTLPNGNPVWFQTDASGNTYAPFRLDMRNTRSTWMGELPHGRRDQVEARNGGRHDRWLVAKVPEAQEYACVPLTLGHYAREDLPFHYALADAFTVCDQAFCSVLGPTIPNRLHLWTGTVRAGHAPSDRAHVENEDTDFGAEVSWRTFPERLEELGVSWRCYQNELAVPSGLVGERDAWLSNFGDNPLEFFTQYGVYFHDGHRRHLEGQVARLAALVARIEASAPQLPAEAARRRSRCLERMAALQSHLARWSEEAKSRLSPAARSLHERAFTTNRADPDYRRLSTLRYADTGAEREMVVPKGDILRQFREDVRQGRLPQVSWIVPAERFSDHPSNPWYGALYLSETLDILTRDPAVWRKTIFILCYDENDGFFDHVPPFVPPRTDIPGTGRASAGIDTDDEFVREDGPRDPEGHGPGPGGRDGPIGLGYRVPLVIASPWSRGGYVCSEVFDHTSILRFLEVFVGAKTGSDVRETNISAWRRAVCGDLTSAFRPCGPDVGRFPKPLHRDLFLAGINRAQYLPVPQGFVRAGPSEISAGQGRGGLLPEQEAGIRPSCALPYALACDGALDPTRGSFRIRFRAGLCAFGGRSAGAPFHVYSPARCRTRLEPGRFEAGRTWAYAVAAGDEVEDAWPLGDFEHGAYRLRIHGPNGFFREFSGDASDPAVGIVLRPAAASPGDAEIVLSPSGGVPVTVTLEDLSYGGRWSEVVLDAAAGAAPATVNVPLAPSGGWYDLTVRVRGHEAFAQRFCGRIEDGREKSSDPAMA
jgi:phospholipase C